MQFVVRTVMVLATTVLIKFFFEKKLSMVQNICTAGPPLPIFGKQGLHNGGHIANVLQLSILAKFRQGLGLGGLANRGGPVHCRVL